MNVTMGGQSFGLESKAPGGLILKIAEAETNGDVGRAMVLTLRMLRLLIASEDRERFEEFIESDEFDRLDFVDIQNALQRATEGAAHRPTVKSPPSPGGSPPTSASPRVVRLSPVTTPASSTGGISQVS